jgi:hypothetical protein
MADYRPIIRALADHYHACYHAVLDIESEAQMTAECYLHMRETVVSGIDEAAAERGAVDLLDGLHKLAENLATARADLLAAINAYQELVT